MDERKQSLRAQLQTDDPSSPANAMSTLAKMWADWRMNQHKETMEDPQAMPFSAGGLAGIVKRTQLLHVLKNMMRRDGNLDIKDYRLLDSLQNKQPWWEEHLHKIGGPAKMSAEPLSSGSQSYAFDLIPKAGEPKTGLGAEVLKLFKSTTPTFERVLQNPPKGALGATRHGIAPPPYEGGDSQIGFYVQPRAAKVLDEYYWPGAYESRQAMGRTETPWGRYSDIVRDLDQKAAERGMSFWDDWLPNVGIHRNKPAVIDLGAYGLPTQRRSPMGSLPPSAVDWMSGSRRLPWSP